MAGARLIDLRGLRCAQRPSVFSLAGTDFALTRADPSVLEAQISVRRGHLMASALAVSQWELDLALSIDGLGHRLQVGRVDAEGVAAEMVEDKAGRDFDGVDQLVGEAMSLHDSPACLESSVAGRLGSHEVPASSPDPAAIDLRYLGPEPSQHR